MLVEPATKGVGGLRAGIPVSRQMQGEVAELVRMEDVLHARVVGQDHAVGAVADAIRRSRSGLTPC